MTTAIPNEMILASAGSGKTYQLTNRYIRLMALGAAPERIVALTFTRKAAGEFFDEILKKLARAAGDASEAQALAEAVRHPGLDTRAAGEMLATLVDRMHLLELGTLDSFFYRIVRNFPFELGLSSPPEVLDENAMRGEKRRVLRHVFRHPGQAGEAARREFLEAFKQATWGAEEKRLSTKLDQFVDRHHEVYLSAPERELWGREQRIWPDGCRWLGGDIDHRQELQVLEDGFANRELTDAQRETWRKFSAAAALWEPVAPWSKDMARPVSNALKVWPDLEAGAAEWMIGRKKLPLDSAECAALRGVVHCLFASELEKKLQVTRGVYEILRGYETVYAELVRSGGRLTFADILILLSGGAAGGERPRLSQESGGPGRLAVDYRIDGHYDHWLLDEFQDTSFVQWRALSDLIDEVVQDPEGRRSFFYVGDVKQAIFAWREGDARLFREIFDHYNGAGGAGIEERRMSESWRSAPAVIDSVNRVFGDHQTMQALYPEESVRRWAGGWDRHEARHHDRKGCVRLFQADEKQEGRHAAVLAVLRQVDPLARGLSCAVLVQTNDQAADILQYLRAHGPFSVAGEMDIRPGKDNPLGVALISLFKWAAYPGDRYAWEHIRMTPLGGILDERFPGGRAAACRGILESVYRGGYAAVAADWISLLEARGALDAFNRERGEIIVTAARAFDDSGRRSAADFIEYLADYSLRETGAEHTIRIMTIHKSKGLGFDMVVLPELQGDRLDSRRRNLAVSRTAEREVEWVLDPPAREIMEHDDVLAAYDRAAAADACYERFCQLYVAMTRAKRATYLMIDPLPKRSTSANFARWLNDTLVDGEPAPVEWDGPEVKLLYETGDAEWYREFASGRPEAIAEEASRPPAREYAPRERRRRGTPSQAKPRTVGAERLFSFDSRRGLEFGTRVHEVFARVGWCEPGTVEELETLRRAEADSPLKEEAFDEVLACLRDPAVGEALARPEGEAELWRERTFEVILDGEWLTGAFDRVTLTSDAEGRVRRAEILDYKTDRGEGDLSGYSRQLTSYRRVLAFMTGLPENEIVCRLLFTHRRELLEVE